MKQFFLLIVLSILFFSCKDKKEEFTEKIAGNSVKYWDCYGKMENGKKHLSERPKMCLEFNINGDYLSYTYYTKYKMYDDSEGSDVIYENKWEYVDENQMELDGRKVGILFLSEDSLACNYEGDDGVFFFTPRKQKAKIIHRDEAWQ